MRYRKIIALIVVLAMMLPVQAFAFDTDPQQQSGTEIEAYGQASGYDASGTETEASDDTAEPEAAGDEYQETSEEATAPDEASAGLGATDEEPLIEKEPTEEGPAAAPPVMRGAPTDPGDWTADDFTYQDTDLISAGWSIAPVNNNGDKLDEEICIVRPTQI